MRQKHFIPSGRLLVLALLWGAVAAEAPAGGADPSIRGTITKHNGDPARAVVEYVRNATYGNADTAADGTYTVSLAEAGTYKVRAYTRGFAPSPPQNVQVEAGAATTHNIQIPDVRYSIKDLGVKAVDGQAAAFSHGYDINSSGEVVGVNYTYTLTVINGSMFDVLDHAFVHRGDALRVIGPGTAWGVNDRGDVVGQTRPSITGFIYSGLQLTDLGTPGTGGRSIARSVNDVGLIAGSYSSVGSQERPAVCDPSAPAGQRWSEIGTLGGRTGTAHSINSSFFVVGRSTNAEGFGYAFLWGDFFGTFQPLSLGLGSLGGRSSSASGLNDFLGVVGESTLAGMMGESSKPLHAFCWRPTSLGMFDMGLPRRFPATTSYHAADINNSYRAVGSGTFLEGMGMTLTLLEKAVQWDITERSSFKMPLDNLLAADSKVQLTEAHAINDAGQITGTAVVAPGLANRFFKAERAFLLSPPRPGNKPPKGKVDAGPGFSSTSAFVSFTGKDSYDEDGSILEYFWDFGDGQTQVTSLPSASHRYEVPGTYVAILTVTDDQGDSDVDAAEVIVQDPDGVNFPPRVIAGRDQTVYFDSWRVLLHGWVTDEGLPSKAPLTLRWSQVKGPGKAVFENDSDLVTQAIFDAAGEYLLALDADDGECVSRSTLRVTVVGVEEGKITPKRR